MDSGWFAVVGALVGTVGGAFSSLVIARIKQRADEKKQIRQMALEVALAEHHRIIKCAKGVTLVPPVYSHIPIAYIAVSRFMSGKVKPRHMNKYYKEISNMIDKSAEGTRNHMPPFKG